MLWRKIALSRWLKPAGAIISGVLLASAYPPFKSEGSAAWMALIPLLVVCRFSTPRAGFFLGFLSGAVFWATSLSWLLVIAKTGCPIMECPALLGVAAWAAVAIYCSLYTAVFSAAASAWFVRYSAHDWRRNMLFMLAAPAFWVTMEYVRTVLFGGFPWNTLGVSQYLNPIVCQSAEWGGVYAVSAAIVVVNAGIALTILNWQGAAAAGRYRTHPEMMAALVVLGVILWTGGRSVMRSGQPVTTLEISAVQPNIPQVNKWDEEWIKFIYQRLNDVTRKASAPWTDLVIWPETALPSYVLEDPECSGFVQQLLTNGIPILAGSMDARMNGSEEEYYVSSMLFQDGEGVQIYDKRHLVPIGEYIPLRSVIPALDRLAPLGWSCTPGRSDAVVWLNRGSRIGIGCLICFEDVFPALAMRSVRNGARLLVDQTNDAWFDPSAGSVQHMAHCVFRCIENRVPAVRVTNTGVTCLIDRFGRVINDIRVARFMDDAGSVESDPVKTVLKSGFMAATVGVPPQDMPLTFYTRHGDVFATACSFLTLVFLACCAVRWLKRTTKRSR